MTGYRLDEGTSKKEISKNFEAILTQEIKEKYNNLSQDEKEEIEKQSFDSYVKKAGGNSSIIKIAFQNGKSSIIAEYLKEIKYFENKNQDIKYNKIDLDEATSKEFKDKKEVLDRKAVSKIIRETTDKFSLIYGLSGDEELDLKVKVAEELLKEGNLTEPLVNKIFEKMIEKLQKNI
ncbi:MAG: hypothetical protein ACRCZ9_03710 [Fusobacteriaceae bacterium]